MTSMTLRKLLLPAILLPLAASGCGGSGGAGTTTPVNAVEPTPGEADETETEGTREEAEATPKETPEQARARAVAAAIPVLKRQTQLLIANYLTVGGFWAWKTPYAPGEWTRWKGHFERVKVEDESEEPQEVEVAFLVAQPDGSEWWRLGATMEDGSAVTLEFLVSADRKNLVKLIGRRGYGDPIEVPLDGEEAVLPAAKTLDRREIDGKKGKLLDFVVHGDTVRGTLIPWKAVDGRKMEIFHAKGIPGGLLRMSVIFDDDAANLIELLRHGKGATTELGAY